MIIRGGWTALSRHVKGQRAMNNERRLERYCETNKKRIDKNIRVGVGSGVWAVSALGVTLHYWSSQKVAHSVCYVHLAFGFRLE